MLARAGEQGRIDGEAARAARQTLQDLSDAVNLDYRDPSNSWDRSTMDYWRWRVARAAMDLQEELQ